MEPPETIETDSTRISCDGGGALGHPKIYLNMGANTFVDCPYCGRRFVLRQADQAASGD